MDQREAMFEDDDDSSAWELTSLEFTAVAGFCVCVYAVMCIGYWCAPPNLFSEPKPHTV